MIVKAPVSPRLQHHDIGLDDADAGVWSIWEASTRHVAAPSIATAHFLRLVSANRGEREQVIKHMNLPQPSKAPANLNKEEFINKLHE